MDKCDFDQEGFSRKRSIFRGNAFIVTYKELNVTGAILSWGSQEVSYIFQVNKRSFCVPGSKVSDWLRNSILVMRKVCEGYCFETFQNMGDKLPNVEYFICPSL